jgi:hypothetical protein
MNPAACDLFPEETVFQVELKLFGFILDPIKKKLSIGKAEQVSYRLEENGRPAPIHIDLAFKIRAKESTIAKTGCET